MRGNILGNITKNVGETHAVVEDDGDGQIQLLIVDKKGDGLHERDFSLGNGVGVDLGHGEELRLDVGEEQQAEDTDGAEGAEDDEQVHEIGENGGDVTGDQGASEARELEDGEEGTVVVTGGITEGYGE